MFSNASTLSHRPHQFANAYRQVGVQTGVNAASPHQLIAMLFEAYMDAIAQARGALRSGQVEAKCRAVARAVSIVSEGLRGGLDLRAGGTLAQDLDDLYGYLAMRLTLANIRNDEAALDECQRLVQPLREAWMSIADRADR